MSGLIQAVIASFKTETVSSGHRYWRLYLHGGASLYIAATEIEMRSTIGGADECSGGAAIYSTQYSGMPASNAFDNNASTIWACNGIVPAWIGYDFGAGNNKSIVEVSYKLRNDGSWNQYPLYFVLQYSDDGSTWVDSINYAPIWSGIGDVKVFNASSFESLPEGSYRYWRMYITGVQGHTFVGATEIEMRSTIGGADECSGGAVIYSTQYSGMPASNAFDNNASSEWADNGTHGNKWIGYDFGAGNNKSIVEVSYKCRNSDAWQAPVSFLMQASTDGTTWKTAWLVNSTGVWANGQTKVFARP